MINQIINKSCLSVAGGWLLLAVYIITAYQISGDRLAPRWTKQVTLAEMGNCFRHNIYYVHAYFVFEV